MTVFNLIKAINKNFLVTKGTDDDVDFYTEYYPLYERMLKIVSGALTMPIRHKPSLPFDYDINSPQQGIAFPVLQRLFYWETTEPLDPQKVGTIGDYILSKLRLNSCLSPER